MAITHPAITLAVTSIFTELPPIPIHLIALTILTDLIVLDLPTLLLSGANTTNSAYRNGHWITLVIVKVVINTVFTNTQRKYICHAPYQPFSLLLSSTAPIAKELDANFKILSDTCSSY